MGPFTVIHNFRTIYKRKRRSLLRKRKIAREKEMEHHHSSNSNPPVNTREEEEESLWDVLCMDIKEEQSLIPTFFRDEMEPDSMFTCSKPTGQGLEILEEILFN